MIPRVASTNLRAHVMEGQLAVLCVYMYTCMFESFTGQSPSTPVVSTLSAMYLNVCGGVQLSTPTVST